MSSFLLSSAVDGQPPRAASPRRTAHGGTVGLAGSPVDGCHGQQCSMGYEISMRASGERLKRSEDRSCLPSTKAWNCSNLS